LELINDILKKNYRLGRLLDIEEILIGYCNQSFTVWMKKNKFISKFVVRRYRLGKAEQEIKFEHALIYHLRKNGFKLTPDLIPQTDGNSYVKIQELDKGKPVVRFWAIFEFLEGETRYTWMDTDLSDAEITSAGRVLARLHCAAQNFPILPGSGRLQPKIMDFLPTFQLPYHKFANGAGKTKCGRLFLKNMDNILAIIRKIKMPFLPIHGDYHQGNLKYEEGRVVGVFDFDWAKIDFRSFDIALAVIYFSANWEKKSAGRLDLDKFETFIGSYNTACRSSESPGHLTSMEKKFFPSMLAAANLFVLHWAIEDFFTAVNPNDDEYQEYFDHSIKLMYWIENHQRLLADWIGL
jgi:homoserine kinase type II